MAGGDRLRDVDAPDTRAMARSVRWPSQRATARRPGRGWARAGGTRLRDAAAPDTRAMARSVRWPSQRATARSLGRDLPLANHTTWAVGLPAGRSVLAAPRAPRCVGR